MRKALPVIVLCIAFCAFAQKRPANWHHGLSPYRAVYSVKDGGNPQAGALLEVPICETCDASGVNVFCYSESGKFLPSNYLGIGTQNCALVQTMPDRQGGAIYAYFGSDQKATAARFELAPALCQVYAIKGKQKNWTDLSVFLKPSALLGQLPVDEFVRIGNPVDSREEFAVVLSAKMDVRSDCSRNLFIVSDDAGYLFIDGRLVISRDGIHSIWDSMHGENHKFVELKSGYHDIKLVGANYEKEFTVAIGEWFPSGKVSHLPKTLYVQPARTSLQSIEALRKDAQIPVFKYKHLADMPLGDRHLTITEFETFSGHEATWTFGDGVVLSGAKITRAFGSLEAMKVKVKSGRNSAGGAVMFPQLAPGRLESASKQSDYDEFDSLIGKEMIAGANVDVLYALMDFYGRREFHPKQMLVAESLLTKDGVPEDKRSEACLMLARSAALENPDKALKAYQQMLQGQLPKKVRFSDMLCEAFEFALFGMRDFEVADSLLRKYSRRLQRNRKALVAMEYDLALQQGRMEEANGLYQELLEGRTDKTERRTAAVK